MGHLGTTVELPGDVDLVVAPVGPDAPGAQEPPPETEPALLDELPAEHQPAALDAIVAPQLLAHAVDEDRVRLPHTGGEGHPPPPPRTKLPLPPGDYAHPPRARPA